MTSRCGPLSSGARPGPDLPGGTALVERANTWTLAELPAMNRDILAGRRRPTELADALDHAVLHDLPVPETFSPRQAQQLVVHLGLAGASMGRHYQEHDPANRATPERSFGRLAVGPTAVGFREYFGRLADRTGTGHCHRDSYASLVRWNLPTTEVWWADQRLAVMPGVFDDGQIRTYVGTADERRFFELLKLSESLELAVNVTLMPLSDGGVDLCGEEALHRIATATVLLTALRRLNTDFAALPATEGMRPDFFLDVFRQYAVHWDVGDIPPSGALDPEALARDLLLGIALPQYRTHVRHMFPGLLQAERSALTTLLDRPSITQAALDALGIEVAASPEDARDTLMRDVDRHPVLAALYLLLNAHARLGGVHLMLSKKFLFEPQRQRESAGLGDTGVVSNRRGTTGMDESRLAQLTRARQDHILAALRDVPAERLRELARPNAVPDEVPVDLDDVVRFVTPDRAPGASAPHAGVRGDLHRLGNR